MNKIAETTFFARFLQWLKEGKEKLVAKIKDVLPKRKEKQPQALVEEAAVADVIEPRVSEEEVPVSKDDSSTETIQE